MALGWLQDAVLHPALIHGEGISWGVPSPGELVWTQGSTHRSVRGMLAAVGRSTFPLWIRDAAAKLLKGWGERAVAGEWRVRGQARDAHVQAESLS